MVRMGLCAGLGMGVSRRFSIWLGREVSRGDGVLGLQLCVVGQ